MDGLKDVAERQAVQLRDTVNSDRQLFAKRLEDGFNMNIELYRQQRDQMSSEIQTALSGSYLSTFEPRIKMILEDNYTVLQESIATQKVLALEQQKQLLAMEIAHREQKGIQGPLMRQLEQAQIAWRELEHTQIARREEGHAMAIALRDGIQGMFRPLMLQLEQAQLRYAEKEGIEWESRFLALQQDV